MTSNEITSSLQPRSVNKANYSFMEIVTLREQNFKVLPVLDADKRVVNVINFRYTKVLFAT